MITSLRQSTPTAIKEHICMLCGCKIAVGQKYRRQTNVMDGYPPYDFINHLECSWIAQDLDMYKECDYDEGLTDEIFREIIDDYIYDTHNDENIDDVSVEWQNLSMYEKVLKIEKEIAESMKSE